MKREIRFWDKRAEKYSKRHIADEATYEEKLRITRTYFSPDSQVLEIGCGTGSTALAHAPFVKHVLATDGSPGMIKVAQSKAETSQVGNVSFEAVAVDDQHIPESRYDVMMAHNLLHLLDDKETAIGKAFRGLRPGGVFVTSTACIGDMTWVFKVIVPVVCFLRLIPQVKVFTQAQLVQSMVDAGFEIEHEWSPKKNAALFLIARKPGDPASIKAI